MFKMYVLNVLLFQILYENNNWQFIVLHIQNISILFEMVHIKF